MTQLLGINVGVTFGGNGSEGECGADMGGREFADANSGLGFGAQGAQPWFQNQGGGGDDQAMSGYDQGFGFGMQSPGEGVEGGHHHHHHHHHDAGSQGQSNWSNQQDGSGEFGGGYDNQASSGFGGWQQGGGENVNVHVQVNDNQGYGGGMDGTGLGFNVGASAGQGLGFNVGAGQAFGAGFQNGQAYGAGFEEGLAYGHGFEAGVASVMGGHRNLGYLGGMGGIGAGQGARSVQQAPAPTVSNGTLTQGDYTYQFSGGSLTMTNTKTGEKTTVWGDPHITNPNGSSETMNGNFTFDLGGGTKVTVVTNNGVVAGAAVQQGVVGQNSEASSVVVSNGRYTSTLNSDGTVNVARGAGDPANQLGTQLIEQNQAWVQAGAQG